MKKVMNPRIETLDCLDARLVELDLLEQALNRGVDLQTYKLQRLDDIMRRRKRVKFHKLIDSNNN